MKRIHHLFSKRAPEAMPEVKQVGISESDYYKIYNALVKEHEEAKARQKKSDAAPSSYMRGLNFALKTLDSIRPYSM